MDEVSLVPLVIDADYSTDTDGTETLSVRLTVEFDAMVGHIGNLTLVPTVSDVMFILGMNGTYLVTAMGMTPVQIEAKQAR